MPRLRKPAEERREGRVIGRKLRHIRRPRRAPWRASRCGAAHAGRRSRPRPPARRLPASRPHNRSDRAALGLRISDVLPPSPKRMALPFRSRIGRPAAIARCTARLPNRPQTPDSRRARPAAGLGNRVGASRRSRCRARNGSRCREGRSWPWAGIGVRGRGLLRSRAEHLGITKMKEKTNWWKIYHHPVMKESPSSQHGAQSLPFYHQDVDSIPLVIHEESDVRTVGIVKPLS